MKTNLIAIILAAGKGSRIGCPKWQLPFKNSTFLEVLVNKFLQAKIHKIVCVTRSTSIPPEQKNIKIIINPNPEYEMISSIYCGVQSHRNADGYLICPVDHPHIKVATINKLTEAFQNNSDEVIRPVFQSKPGHPIILPGKLAQQIPNKNIKGGLRQFLFANNAIKCNIAVDDAGVLKNINLKGDLHE